MIRYNDIFKWEPKAGDGGTLWLSSCRLCIIELPESEKIFHLKPNIVVASDLNTGPKRKICAEVIGKQIFREFNLDIKRTVWIEHDPDTPYKLMVAQFTPKYHDGTETIFSITWRRLLDSELNILRKYLPDLT